MAPPQRSWPKVGPRRRRPCRVFPDWLEHVHQRRAHQVLVRVPEQRFEKRTRPPGKLLLLLLATRDKEPEEVALQKLVRGQLAASVPLREKMSLDLGAHLRKALHQHHREAPVVALAFHYPAPACGFSRSTLSSTGTFSARLSVAMRCSASAAESQRDIAGSWTKRPILPRPSTLRGKLSSSLTQRSPFSIRLPMSRRITPSTTSPSTG